MDNAPDTTASDNGLTAGYTPEQTAAPAADQGQAPATPDSWHSGFSDDFRGLLEKKGLTDLSQQEATESLGKSYANLESMRNIPDDNLYNVSPDMTDESRDKLYNAMGRPEDSSKYSYETLETDHPDLVDAFKSASHELGLSDKQVSELIPRLNEKIVAIAEGQNADMQSKNNEGLAALQKEWGGAWEANKNMATRAGEYFGITESMQEAIVQSGNSAAFMKALNQMGGLMAEGAMAGMSPQSGSAAMGVMTPEAAQSEISAKMNNPDFMKRYHSQDQSTRVAASKELEVFRKAAVGKR